ncbi:hypothetical protein BO70DRAFT_415451 [Aspergillus heteromorphus CBS 117.55]|uniref:Rhodopsin domain-containing protein n=1 Tax=Aspergillus heteromorphus CBS 117.55 TaxID=1448321 RepID=A0A317WUI4_9EURO|nr:uncharacterized protein BO70DRAFT_415451 [Aspergillus heteromorphus CBS 117.55]PWY90016.1 hypothetical protein BO70DRAFT_415451 [Aspergillus heteromorphus CBS 117.55]
MSNDTTTTTTTGEIAPPAGVTPDFTDPSRYLQTANRVVVIVGVTASAICLLVRTYTRVVIMRKWMLDDDGYTDAGLGIHEWDLTAAEYNKSLRILLAGAITYIPALGLSKIALIILYYRLSDMQRRWKTTLWTISSLVVLYILVLDWLLIFGCKPIHKAWNTTVEGTCISRAGVFMAGASASIVTDIVLLVIPLPIIARLKMKSRKRFGLALMFGLGGLSLITSVLRLVAIVPMLTSEDQSYLLGPVCLWINVEASLVIISACIPSFRQVFRFHASASWNDSSGRRDRASSRSNLRSAQCRREGFTNLSIDGEGDNREDKVLWNFGSLVMGFSGDWGLSIVLGLDGVEWRCGESRDGESREE